MVAITYGLARAAVGAAKNNSKDASRRQGVLSRLLDAMMEARMKQAQRELERHRHLASGLDRAAFDLSTRDLPFGGR